MTAQNLAQGRLQKMCCRMVAGNGEVAHLVNRKSDVVTLLETAFRDDGNDVTEAVGKAFRVGYLGRTVCAHHETRITHLTAAFGVEGRFVENNRYGFVFFRFIHGDTVVAEDDNLPCRRALVNDNVRPFKARRIGNGNGGGYFCPRRTCPFLLGFHRFVEAGLIECKAVLPGNFLGQFQGEPEGIVKAEDLPAFQDLLVTDCRYHFI